MIEKLVRLTPNQYVDILTNGSGTFHDNETGEAITINRDEIGDKYLVDTGYLELIRLTNMIQLDIHHRYGFDGEHRDFEDLETYYDQITTDSDLGAVSAYGYECILKPGDSIPLKTTGLSNVQTYVNGILIEEPYVCRKTSGSEYVSVWIFETDGGFGDEEIIENKPAMSLSVKQRITVPPVPTIFIQTAFYIRADGYALPTTPLAALSIESKNLTQPETKMSGITTTYRSEATYMPQNFTGLNSKTALVSIELPNIAYIGARPDQYPNSLPKGNTANKMFMGCTNPDLEIHFPNLICIAGGSNSTLGTFGSCYRVTIPNTVAKITGCICQNNVYIELQCVNADIDDIWCATAPNTLKLAAGWHKSISLVTSALGVWGADEYVEFLSNIHDHRVNGSLPDGHVAPYIKISANDFSRLITSDDSFAAAVQTAIEKGWTVDGI